MNAPAAFPLTDAPERIAQLIWVLCQTVTMRCSLRVRTLSGAQVEYIVARLLAARTRFRRVVEQVRAGKPPKPRARKPLVRRVKPRRETLAELERGMGYPPPPGWRRRAREDRARARAAEKAAREAAAAGKPVPLWRALRMHVRGWLCGCAPAIPEYRDSAPSHANHLREMLAEPGMQALLLAHPYVGEALRAVCHGLGVEGSLLHLATRPVVDAAPATDERGAATPPAAASVAPATKNVFRPAAGRPPPRGARAMPLWRYPKGSGVVIVDYWDLPRD